jgi:two-component system, cell cycle sensor histidine kinase and response regulator CckA
MNKKNPPDFELLGEVDEPPNVLQDANSGAETIDLEGLSEDPASPSGSFDLTGVRTSSVGKLLQSLPIAAFLIDQRLNIVFANKACSNIDKGYKKMLGSPFSSLVVNTSLGREIQSVLKRVFSSRKHQVRQEAIQICNSRIWARMNFRALKMKEHRSVLVLVEDLTLEKKQNLLAQLHQDELKKEIIDRQRTEEDLRKSEEKYRNIIETIQDGYYEVNRAGNLTFFNDVMCEITGYSREELTNTSYRQLMDEDNAEKILREFNKVRATGSFNKVFDHEITRKDGTTRNVTISISLIRDSLDRPSGFRGICLDITERKRAEGQLLRIEKLESLGVLAGGIAHDFNNILTSILGNISLAKISPQVPDTVTRRLGEAEKGIGRARNLTQQLLTFSRGGSPIKKTASISELVSDSCEFAARGSNVRCALSVPDYIYPVEVDVGQISQVISNLIINAEHAMPEGGVILVRVENVEVTEEDGLSLTNGKYVKLSIQDRGVGIPGKILPKIFDPYFTTQKTGSGLGLATAHSIVKNHGGLITAESEMGVGTTFHIYLPASEKAMTEPNGTDGGFVTGEGRILLMDDEVTIRDMAREMLLMLGYEVDVAKDGTEACALYRSAKDSGNPYTAVILDLTIPGGMGGKETLRKLVEIEPNIKAIVSSGYSNDPIMSEYKRYGFSGVVAKPYGAEELSWTLDSVITGSSDKSSGDK